MSTTANDEKPFKTTLLLAIAASDDCVVDGRNTGTYPGQHDDTDADGHFEDRDAEELIYFKDQEIEICNGKAFFKCIDGITMEVVFRVSRRLTLNDIILNRLTA